MGAFQKGMKNKLIYFNDYQERFERRKWQWLFEVVVYKIKINISNKDQLVTNLFKLNK